MFPLSGILSSASHGNAYSVADVVGILEYAKHINLTVIPLIQTFGHAEWILKTALFSPLRENANYSNVFCIGNDATKDILTDMIGQVASIHAAVGPMPFFHIGADEALIKPGVCEEDMEVMRLLNTTDPKILVFHHLQAMAMAIQNEYPDTKVLAWFDEFKGVEAELMEEYELTERIVPVVWKYWPTSLDKALPDDMWNNLSDAFPTAWGASAFKGANGANQFDNAITPYVANNELWNEMIAKQRVKFNESISAIIITGWQRYDHFTGLCELLPTSMTSLALTMVTIEKGTVTDEDATFISSALSCPPSTGLVQLFAGNDSCLYPGYQVRSTIRELTKLYSDFKNYNYIHNLENGWWGHSQQEKHYGSRYYLESLTTQYSKNLAKLEKIIDKIKNTFDAIYFSETSTEFINDRVLPFKERLSNSITEMSRTIQRHSFHPRPIFRI